MSTVTELSQRMPELLGVKQYEKDDVYYVYEVNRDSQQIRGSIIRTTGIKKTTFEYSTEGTPDNDIAMDVFHRRLQNIEGGFN